jgi:hypothetical protein
MKENSAPALGPFEPSLGFGGGKINRVSAFTPPRYESGRARSAACVGAVFFIAVTLFICVPVVTAKTNPAAYIAV